eukprot:sb/3470591/
MQGCGWYYCCLSGGCVGKELVYNGLGESCHKYVAPAGYCAAVVEQKSSSPQLILSNLSFVVQIAIPACLIVLGFVISLLELLGKSRERRAPSRASVTMALFTGLFLLTNIPFLLTISLLSIGQLKGYEYPEPYFDSPFFYWYIWLIPTVILTALNALLNPCLYFWRMQGLHKWIFNRRGSLGYGTLLTQEVVLQMRDLKPAI